MITKVSTSCSRQSIGVLLDIEGLLDRLLSHERYTLDSKKGGNENHIGLYQLNISLSATDNG